MLKLKSQSIITAAILGWAFLFGGLTEQAAAQIFDNLVPLKKKSTNQPKKTTPRKSNKTQRVDTSSLVKKTAPKRVKVATDNTSYLAITTEPNTKVVLIKSATTRQIVQMASRNGIAEYDDLAPGRYSISATQEGFIPLESEINIPARDSLALSFKLEPVKYVLSIETNIRDGEVRFAPASLEGKNADNSLKLKETGEYCIVPIRNKVAEIKGLKKGYYRILISPSAIEYEPVAAAITPDDLDEEEDDSEKDNTAKTESYKIDLQKKESTEQFFSAWTSNDWVLPAGWNMKNKITTNGTAGMALPKSELYQYYIDFEMISNVISLDGRSIGFVLRAVDRQNYYLVQISGARAPEPFRVTGFVVKDGRQEQIFSNSIPHFATIIAEKKQFRVIIRAVGNVFKLFIEDSATGENRELGNMVDPLGNFKKGAVGISATANSDFEVVFFTVCKSACR